LSIDYPQFQFRLIIKELFAMQMELRHLSYYLLALGAAGLIFLFICWGPVLGLFLTFLIEPTSLSERLASSARLLWLALFDSSPLLTTYNAGISILIGINLALLVYYFKKFQTIPSGGTVTSGALGAVATLLGFGCPSCGTLFLTLLLSSIGATGLTILPLYGYALQVVGFLLLILSTCVLYRKTSGPLVCLS
jgi:hypothetical protein